MKIVFTKDKLNLAIKQSKTFKDVFRKLGLKGSGHHYRLIHRAIKEYNLDDATKHFVGRAWNKGLKIKGQREIPLEKILIKNSTYTSTNRLRKRLIREKIFKHKCNNCKLTKWLGQQIPLELEHKNGIKNDNRKENLELLCPNCHALTPFYRGRNKTRPSDGTGRRAGLKTQ